MEGNINKGSILLTFFKAHLKKSWVFWKMKVFIMPVASLSDSHSSDAEAFSPPWQVFIHLPSGWEASSALNH